MRKLLLLAGLAPCALFAQDPLTFTIVPGKSQYAYTNQSPTAIEAYVLTFRCDDGLYHWHRSVFAPGPDGAPQSHPSGSTWSGRIPVSQGENCQAQVDYVRFADGSSWGPDTTQSAAWFDGMKSGWSNALYWLKRKRVEQGDAAVLDIIRGEAK